MKFWSPWLLLVAIAVSCGSTATGTSELCILAGRIDAVYDAVDDERQFTAEESATVRALVDEMNQLVPPELNATFRLRYWPNTSVTGLDTSGISAQRAYDEWRAYLSSNC